MAEVIAAPEQVPKLTLVYAKMQALGEPARMLLEYAGLHYEDVYAWGYYGPSPKGGKEQAPFGQVPGDVRGSSACPGDTAPLTLQRRA